ncbi:hypothetical protein F4780DRAFT_284103 [Xylariomycetidae sp. FL0641]|nr:hypothetical protein F4780DRAFT_284103 [Xylariomycetidae sp. FL0641]
MLSTTLLLQAIAMGATLTLASPVRPLLAMRGSTDVDPNAASDVQCIDPNVAIDFHDENVAQLGICGSIAGAITKCEGDPTATTGESGSARFDLAPVDAGATLNISKGRWEGCVRAARAVCPTGSLSAVCAGGSSLGDVAFRLDSPF